jgi:homoserine dehydrogenase
MKKINIGLFGFGTVGEGLYKVLQNSKTVDADILKIAVKNKKKRSLPEQYFCYDKQELLEHNDINVIVELIDDANEAYDIVKSALLAGKHVVSGNKKMLAEHLPELIELQKTTGTSLLYDASACGSIPIIRNIEEYYDNDLLKSVTGILNGSSNYILSQIFQHGKSYDLALKEAQDLGFAESDPSSDVEGFDALYKLIIIATHSFGLSVKPEELFNSGISKLNDFDIKYAKDKGLKIKLIAKVWKVDKGISMIVIPFFTRREQYIYNVEDEFNGVVIEGEYYDKQFMFGKGAGAFPTSSAVLSDITALSHQYQYEYKKQKYFKPLSLCNQTIIKIYLRYQNVVDFSLFEFENIEDKYFGQSNYVIGNIKIENLIRIQKILPKLDVFIALL